MKTLYVSHQTPFIKQPTSEDEERKEREKQERIEASLKKREEEVKQSLSSSLRERDKEREQHKKDEAVQHFNALLADLVKKIVSLRIFMLGRVLFC